VDGALDGVGLAIHFNKAAFAGAEFDDGLAGCDAVGAIAENGGDGERAGPADFQGLVDRVGGGFGGGVFRGGELARGGLCGGAAHGRVGPCCIGAGDDCRSGGRGGALCASTIRAGGTRGSRAGCWLRGRSGHQVIALADEINLHFIRCGQALIKLADHHGVFEDCSIDRRRMFFLRSRGGDHGRARAAVGVVAGRGFGGGVAHGGFVGSGEEDSIDRFGRNQRDGRRPGGGCGSILAEVAGVFDQQALAVEYL
jgi:hypothetical protein